MPGSEGFHQSVLLGESLRWLQPGHGKLLVDGTLGGGGHSEAFLEAGACVIGLDQDPQALEFARRRLARFGERFTSVHANFSQIDAVLEELGIQKIDGALLDIGVSSWQLDAPERGFSFMRSGPLDMRMNPEDPKSAADLVNQATGEELERVFREYGEEPAARRVAAAIARERLKKPFETTGELAALIEKTLPRRGKTHPATRVFQALRIAVNRELEVLATGLEKFGARLRPGGRLGVITFHSLEDRMVKNYFREQSAEWIDRPEWPAPKPNPKRIFKLLTPKPVVASEEEQAVNPRSRSAKLRVVERI